MGFPSYKHHHQTKHGYPDLKNSRVFINGAEEAENGESEPRSMSTARSWKPSSSPTRSPVDRRDRSINRLRHHLRRLRFSRLQIQTQPSHFLSRIESSIYVSRLGFGCAGLSGIYNDPLSHEAGCSIIKEAFSKGVTFFDTSDLYGQNYDNEIMVGKALKQFPREKVQLATKFGIIKLEGGQFDVKGTPAYARQCCEASLKRLDLDYIDLYYQHRVDVSVPIEDTMGELKKLVEEGKIKYIGLSEASAETVRRAHAVHPITAVQVEYSLWTRDIEEDIIPLCRELGIGIVAYSPLGRGFFGGKGVVESVPNGSLLAHFPRYTGENLEKNKQLYARLANIAAKHNFTPPQLALAWLLHQEDNVVPIPGTTKVNNLHSAIGSLALKFTVEDLKEISDAVPVDEVAGDRDLEYLKKHSRKFANTPAKS